MSTVISFWLWALSFACVRTKRAMPKTMLNCCLCLWMSTADGGSHIKWIWFTYEIGRPRPFTQIRRIAHHCIWAKHITSEDVHVNLLIISIHTYTSYYCIVVLIWGWPQCGLWVHFQLSFSLFRRNRKTSLMRPHAYCDCLTRQNDRIEWILVR